MKAEQTNKKHAFIQDLGFLLNWYDKVLIKISPMTKEAKKSITDILISIQPNQLRFYGC